MWRRGVAAALLLTATAQAAAEAVAETTAGTTAQADFLLEPDSPRAGAMLLLPLSPEAWQPGRVVVLLDPANDRELQRFRLGRYPRSHIHFRLPADLDSLAIELRQDDAVLQRLPAGGELAVLPATDDMEPSPMAERSMQTEDCPRLPPPATAPAADLLAWLEVCPLEHAPLLGRDLRGVDLAQRNLHRADLRHSDLSDARLRQARLSGASLNGARLDGADLSGAMLDLADLHGASLFVADLDGADLRDADLREADLTHASFSNANLSGARLGDALLDGTDFSGATCPDGTRTEGSCRNHLQLP